MKYAKQRKLTFSDKQDSINQEIFERFVKYIKATSAAFKATFKTVIENARMHGTINKAIAGEK